MIRYREYFLEYFKGNKILNPNAGLSSKRAHIDPSARVNLNFVKKTYKHKHPVIDSICTGKADNVKMAGQPLLRILSLYGTAFTPGVMVLGNSDVEAEMYEDEEGQQVGVLRNRNKGNAV